MRRVVVYNHFTPSTRSIGRFRTQSGAHDHGPGGCSCGGRCASCREAQNDSGSTTAELGIDVTYGKGPQGRKAIETRHYTVPGVQINPNGRPPDPAFVANQLRRLPGHRAMLDNGWTADKTEGYYKRELRVGGDEV